VLHTCVCFEALYMHWFQIKKRFNSERTKCMIVGYCEGMKVYKLMCLETIKMIKMGMLCLLKIMGTCKKIGDESKWEK
jgi:hypothetical protein